MSSAHTSLGAYATDALDGTEALDVKYHLSECEVCRREFDEFSETAAELSRLVATAPPVELRSSVLRSITQIRPLPPEVDDTDTADEVAQPDRPAVVVSLRPRRFGRVLVGIAAAAVIAALGAGGYALDTQHQLTASQSAQLEANRQRQIAQQETAILQAPDASVYSGRLQDGSSVSYLVTKSQNAAMMVSGELSDPGQGKTYQMWTLVRTVDGGTTYLPDHTFGGGRNQRVVVTGDVTDAIGIAITVEPEGGSQHPTGEPDARATF